MTSKVKFEDRQVCITTDGMEFQQLHKAEAHQADLDIREMLTDADFVGVEQDRIMEAFHAVGVYVPQALWAELRK